MPAEFDFIDWIIRQPTPGDSILLPPGDDLAVLKWNPADLLLVGVDQVLDGVHFDSSIHSPGAIGAKVMNRNLSDCAAMGCLPFAAVVTAALPIGSGLDYARELYLGMRRAADKFTCAIVGGDTASWPEKLAATVAILARTAGVQPITRKGAKPGHSLFVTGPLGGSILGRHMDFTPRIDLGRKLAGQNHASAMIDISDGLSRDAQHICRQSNVGMILESQLIPIHPDALTLSARDGISPLHHALHDGEDHELLFTSPASPDCGIRIGQVVADKGLWIRQPDGSVVPLEPKGWEHEL